MRSKLIDVVVGLFIIVGVLALFLLAFKVSGLSHVGDSDYYTLTAEFDNIGGLRVRAPVSISGVTVGRVVNIQLDPTTFRAKVTMHINDSMDNLPQDSSASILTQGLLGSNYISLLPGFEKQILKPGGSIETTHSALILENLVGQLMYSLKGDGGSKKTDSNKDDQQKI